MKLLETILLNSLEFLLKACIYLFFTVVLFITWGIIGIAWVGALPVIFVCYLFYIATKMMFTKVQSAFNNFIKG